MKITGKAVGYTGAAINGAKVRYRVTREVRWPVWFYECCWYRLPPNRGAAQEIAHGTAVTDADGSFTVAFAAKPDPTVPEKDEPTFHYTVHADVTDTTGETRSGSKSVAVSYTALQANLTADEWQTAAKPVKVTVTTTTLDGEGQAAKGTVKVHTVKAPETVRRPDILAPHVQPRRGKGAAATPKPDPNDPRTWPLGDAIATADFATQKDGKAELTFKLEPGLYRAVLTTQDRFGKPVTAQLQLRVLNPDDTKLALKIPHLFTAPKWVLEPGEELLALWGTGYDRGRAYIEVEHMGKVLQAFWTDPAKTQVGVKQTVTEAMRGGFTVRVTFVRENRGYMENRHVDVPWSNKDLTVKWERFVSKLEPAKKETFTAVISGPKATKTAAEMVAALYDASLDAYLPHHWLTKFNVFRHDYSQLNSQFENGPKSMQQFRGQWNGGYQAVDWRYRAFPADITVNLWGYQYFGRNGAERAMPAAPGMAAPAGKMEEALGAASEKQSNLRGDADRKNGGDKQADGAGGPGGPSGPDLSKVAARKNLNETAFFYPHLTTDAAGAVRLEFTMPEALTKWKFMGFAHGTDLKSGYLQDDVVTAKDLMVQPNPPRFLREGDVLEFSVKVSNQSATKQAGTVRLTLADLRSTANIDKAMGNDTLDQPFEMAAGSRAASSGS